MAKQPRYVYNPADPKPQNIEEAVDFIMSCIGSDLPRLLLKIETEEELDKYGIAFSMDMRSRLGIWGTNSELLNQLPQGIGNVPVKAEAFILKEVWKRIHRRAANKTGAEQ
ncbi:MAG: hypothetical protein K1Y36_02780 [Blastocatellia bacterium]|nr:hypothetical protein [Blastocatellia bacterium]